MNWFKYNYEKCEVELCEPEILLVPEFAALMEVSRNKCEEDKTGKKKLRAFREMSYMYLAIDWKSPYYSEPEKVRAEEALNRSKLTKEEFNDETFRRACREYVRLQESILSMKLLLSTRKTVRKIINYFETVEVGKINEEDGKLQIKTKDVIGEINSSSNLIESLNKLEERVKQDLELKDEKIRGDKNLGILDNITE